VGTDEDRTGQCFQASWLDLEGDDQLEVHVANDYGEWGPLNRLYAVQGQDRWQMSEVAADFGAAARVDSMGGAVGDINGDGGPEIVVSHTDHRILLQSYDPVGGRFIDVTTAWGARPPSDAPYDASWAMVLEDVNDDGSLDLLSAWGYPHYLPDDPEWQPQLNSLLLWGGSTFTDASHLLACEAQSYSWHSVLVGDIDRDGAVDLVFTSNIGPTCILRGTPSGRDWLEVALDGPPGNPDGLGARVDVRVGDRTWSRRIAAGNSGLHSDHAHIARFGLGRADSVDEVVVRWPGGGRSTVSDVPTGARIRVAAP
jgi:hypothetical protein